MSQAFCAGISNNGLWIIEIINISLSVFGLIISILITIHSCKEIPKNNTLSPIIKHLFYHALFWNFIIIITTLIQSSICLFTDIYENILGSITIIACCILMLILLATLIYRLYSSFASSAYALSIINITTLTILFSIIVILAAATAVEWLTITIVFDGNWNALHYTITIAAGWVNCVMMAVYIFASSWCVYLFVKKLLKLIKSQQQSVRSLDLANIQLSNSQKNLIDKTSKYASLLTLATVTSFVTGICWIFSQFYWDRHDEYNYNTTNSYITEVMIMIGCMDSTINIVCLYFQFSFASFFYNKYCKLLQYFWEKMITFKVKKFAKKRTIEFRKIKLKTNTDEDESDDETR
eukprot:420223_1